MGAGGAGAASAGGQSTGGQSAGGASQGGSSAAGGGAPSAAELLALTTSCNEITNGRYATDDGEAETIPVCGLSGAVFWTADMDVDCDGKTTAQCNAQTDPSYYPETSATDSNGDPLDAAALPFIVIPLPSSRFDYAAHGIQLGQVVAVIYAGQLRYGVFGDQGPSGIVGEASYAMAESLGIDPDPSFGGSDGPVTYIVFTGAGAVQDPIEDQAATTALGDSLAQALLSAN